MTNAKRTARGFTLIEVLMVIVILGMLGTLGIVSYINIREKSKIDTSQQMIVRVGEALELYNTAVGQYPTEDQGLKALRQRPDFDAAEGGTDPAKRWAGPYLKTTAKDAWGNELVYQPIEKEQLVVDESGNMPQPYKLFSKGPDGQEDTEDDITNEVEEEET